MQSLKQIQSSFAQDIFGSDTSNLPNVTNETRLQIYKDNVLLTLCDNLKSKYPIICRIVDEQFFNYAANEYVKVYKPISSNIDEYGEHFYKFISEFTPTKQMFYLSDVAKLEWAIHTAYFAADVEKIDPTALAKATHQQLENLRFSLHPSATIISSVYAIDKIWHIAQNEFKDNDIDINSGGANLLVVRPEYKAEVHILENGEAEFLTALQSKETLYNAFEKAIAKNNKFDIGSAIQKFTLNGTFTAFS
jgi:hypothetical protein